MKYLKIILLCFSILLGTNHLLWANTPETQTEVRASTHWREYYKQGKWFREQGNSYRALQQLLLADSLYQEQETQPIFNDTIGRELAQCYFIRGRYQESIALCEKLLQTDTLSDDLYLIARCFEKTEQPIPALQYQVLAATYNIENVNNLLSLTKNLIELDEAKQALTFLDQYCAIDSTNNVINAVRAFAFYKANQFQEAVNAYEKLQAEGDSTATTHFYLGLSYYRLGDVPSAYDYLKLAVEQTQRNNPNILSRLGLAELSIALGNITFTNPKKNWGLVNDLIQADTASYHLASQLVNDINQQGIADIEEAIQKMQPNAETLFLLYNSMGNYYAFQNTEKAIPYYRKALEVSPSHANVHYQLGYCYHKQKDYKNELKSYEKFLNLAQPDEDPNAKAYAEECIENCKKVLFMHTDNIQ